MRTSSPRCPVTRRAPPAAAHDLVGVEPLAGVAVAADRRAATSAASRAPPPRWPRRPPRRAGRGRGRRPRWPATASPSRSSAQAGASGQEDLAAPVVGGGAGAGQAEADPAGQPRAAGAVDRRVGDDDADARARRAAGSAAGHGGSSRPTGTPATVSRSRSPKFVSSSTPTVWPGGMTRDDVPMPPLKPRQDMPVPAATAPSSGGGADAARREGRAHAPRARRSVDTCIRRQSLRKESSHSPTTGITTSSATLRVLLERDLAGRVVHPAQLHRRRQEDRRLERAPLLADRKPVHSPAPLSTAPPAASGRRYASSAATSDRDTGARGTSTVRRGLLVTDQGRMSQTHTIHIKHGPAGPDRSAPISIPRSLGLGTTPSDQPSGPLSRIVKTCAE